MFLMFCQQLLQAPAEGLQLSLAREPLDAEELGDKGLLGCHLAYHGAGPGVEGMRGVGPGSFTSQRAERERGREGGADGYAFSPFFIVKKLFSSQEAARERKGRATASWSQRPDLPGRRGLWLCSLRSSQQLHFQLRGA